MLDNVGGTMSCWHMQGDPSGWKCFEKFGGEHGPVYCMVSLRGGLVAVGFDRQALCVYDVAKGTLVAGPLGGHTGAVTAVTVSGTRLYSASRGKDDYYKGWQEARLVVHSIKTWQLVLEGPQLRRGEQNVRSLLVAGPVLVTGASGPKYSATTEYEVVIMDAATLAPLRVMRQGPGENVLCLLSTSGAVWATAGRKLVVWRNSGGLERGEFLSLGPRRFQLM